MKCFHAIWALALSLSGLTGGAQPRQVIPFDKDWVFYKGDSTGFEGPDWNDNNWRKLHLPHDWSIEGPYDRSNPTARGGGYLPAGVGWYRKHFSLDKKEAQKQVRIEFDGVMANSEVWINGHGLGKRPYGYSSFTYDLTPFINFGGPNVISVRADNTVQPASRYYTGAGIYRHVRLVVADPVHIEHWGVFITAPQVSSDGATVLVQTTLVNTTAAAKDISLETKLLDPVGKITGTGTVKQTVPAGKTTSVSQEITVAKPVLWTVDKPAMYSAESSVKAGSQIIDNTTTPFGIRSAVFDAAKGFVLNGQPVKIKGVCLHHDGGAVGAAVPLGVWEERFKLLKQVGVNGIRTSHNPVAPEFLDLCDRMGFLVMDETFDTWMSAKNNGEKGYNLYFKDWWERDTRDMVVRDRNHPSLVIYSVGNEIHDNLNDSAGFKKYRDQQDLVHRLDPSRPVTMALFRPANSKVYTNGFADKMDVVGQNYRENELIAAHEAHPNWKVIGTENTHVLSMWLALRDKPYMAGQFLWTGFDYLGEADWPETTNNQGLFDRSGGWKQQGLQRESWWSKEPVVHLVRRSDNAGAGGWVADWTPVDFDTYDNAKVQVYSNCDEVELFLNGKSEGVKTKPENDAPREWDLTFEKGEIKAVGRNGGKIVASESFTSAGAPAAVKLSVSKQTIGQNWDDVVFVTATVVDANGNLCPNADNLLKFSITGAGLIAGVDNGNIISHESYQATDHHAYRGRCIAIVKATPGKADIKVKVEGEGLRENSVIIGIR